MPLPFLTCPREPPKAPQVPIFSAKIALPSAVTYCSTRPPSISAKGFHIHQPVHFSAASQAQTMTFLSSKVETYVARNPSQWLWLL